MYITKGWQHYWPEEWKQPPKRANQLKEKRNEKFQTVHFWAHFVQRVYNLSSVQCISWMYRLQSKTLNKLHQSYFLLARFIDQVYTKLLIRRWFNYWLREDKYVRGTKKVWMPLIKIKNRRLNLTRNGVLHQCKSFENDYWCPARSIRHHDQEEP